MMSDPEYNILKPIVPIMSEFKSWVRYRKLIFGGHGAILKKMKNTKSIFTGPYDVLRVHSLYLENRFDILLMTCQFGCWKIVFGRILPQDQLTEESRR